MPKTIDATSPPRRRPPTPEELRGIAWLPRLAPAERVLAVMALRVSELEPGEVLCRIGQPQTHWHGVAAGLLKAGADGRLGQPVTFAGLGPGHWFGEGTALKREAYRYNVQALRRSRVISLPLASFDWLLDHSSGFSRFVMDQLNERLGQMVAAREVERLNNPELSVARCLAALCHPALAPGTGEVLRITQQELAYLVGLSRQRVNEALGALAAQGLIQREYGGLRILDLVGLREGGFERELRPVGR